MQDRFKFRFYDKTKKIMIKPTEEMNNTELERIYSEYGQTEWYWYIEATMPTIFSYFDTGKYYPDNDWVLMQCTGLKDKNGKLIYEGDIVQFYDDEFLQTMKIVWDNDEVDFKAIGLKKSVECYGKNFSYLGCIKKEDSLEVIGNIYQDSHLLEN